MTIAEIEDAVLDRLETAGLNVRLEVKKGLAGIPKPTVHLSVDAGRFEKVSQSTYRETIVLSLYVGFRNVKSEKDRRRGVYPIVEGIVGILILQTLDLGGVTPFIPKGFRNVTDSEMDQAGEVAYLLEFETSYPVSRTETESSADLLTTGLNYFLKPGDNVADASDVVDLGS